MPGEREKEIYSLTLTPAHQGERGGEGREREDAVRMVSVSIARNVALPRVILNQSMSYSGGNSEAH